MARWQFLLVGEEKPIQFEAGGDLPLIDQGCLWVVGKGTKRGPKVYDRIIPLSRIQSISPAPPDSPRRTRRAG